MQQMDAARNLTRGRAEEWLCKLRKERLLLQNRSIKLLHMADMWLWASWLTWIMCQGNPQQDQNCYSLD